MTCEKEVILDWTSKQGRILTSCGKALEYYTAERGYPFEKEELPHFHLINDLTESEFSSWASEQNMEKNVVCGAFSRSIFVGGFEFTTNHDEVVYNVQTNTLFIDMRIPRKQDAYFKDVKGFDDMDDNQLMIFARRHAFAGYTRLLHENNRPLCTRHHCIDWNFVGVPRPRPNKWWVDFKADGTTWKELSYAKDEDDQHYYWEQWERYKDDGYGNGLVVALRKERTAENKRDGIIVLVGDHFNYIHGRQKIDDESQENRNIIEIVETSIKCGDRTIAENYLSIDAGHGLISKGWTIDCALQPWKEGSKCFRSVSFLKSSDAEPMKIIIDDCPWKIYECNIKPDDLRRVFQWKTRDAAFVDFDLESILSGTVGKKRNASSL